MFDIAKDWKKKKKNWKKGKKKRNEKWEKVKKQQQVFFTFAFLYRKVYILFEKIFGKT